MACGMYTYLQSLWNPSPPGVPLREFLRLGNPLNCGAWDKKLLKQYRVHKPSSLSDRKSVV